MSASSASKPAENRSYLGIGSCCVFGIATACVVAPVVASVTEPYKMAGFEGIFLWPFALFLYLLGATLGFAGTVRPTNNPLSRTGDSQSASPVRPGACRRGIRDSHLLVGIVPMSQPPRFRDVWPTYRWVALLVFALTLAYLAWFLHSVAVLAFWIAELVCVVGLMIRDRWWRSKTDRSDIDTMD